MFRDQTAALLWVRDNISRFGGNPNNITVGGHSAGASSADLLSLSPHSRDLFRNVICIGGSSFNNWALTQPHRTLKKALEFAKRRGFEASENNTELVRHLRQLPTEQLKVASHGIPTASQSNAIAMYELKHFPTPYGKKYSKNQFLIDLSQKHFG